MLTLPVYAYLYPLLKRYVLFHGLQELILFLLMNTNSYPERSDIVFSCSYLRFH
jgi:hypothetical protein